MKSDLKEKSGFFTNPVKQILSHSFINLFILWSMGIIWIFLSLIMPEQIGKITKIFSSGKEVTWALVEHRIFLMIAAQFALSITVYLRGRMLDLLQEKTFRSLVLDMFRRILRFKGSFFRDNEIEKINVRMFDDGKIFSTFYSALLGDISIEIVCVIIFSYIMISTHWLLGITIIAISFLLCYVILFDSKIQLTTKKVQQNWEKARIDSHDLLSCIPEIRNNSIFEYSELKFKKTLDNLYNVKIDCSKLTSLFTAMGSMVRNIQMAGLFTVGACLCIGSNLLSDLTGKIQWGDVIQFSIMAQIFQVRFARIADFFIQWRLANQSIIRVKEYLGQPCRFINSSKNPPLLPKRKNISFQDISVSHGGSVKILDKINLNIHEGTHAAFVGPSGSGKTTLISLIGRDNEPSSGEVKIGDETVQNYNIQSLGKETGNVSQKSFILNTSIRNNLLLGLRHSEGQLKDEEGPIDIEKLNIKTIDELNDKIIETIRLTGLEDDILEKFLAAPMPQNLSACNILRNHIDDIRKDIIQKIFKTDENVIVKFDCNHIIEGTLFENILGPGFSMQNNFDICRPFLYKILEENNLYEDLSQAGNKIFMADYALPEIIKNIFSSQNVSEYPCYHTGHLSEESEFLKTALSSDIKTLLSVKETLKEKIIKLRYILKDEYRDKTTWTDLEKGTYIDRLSVRENFISGRPAREFFNAVKAIDIIIKETLKEKNLFREALLIGLEFPAGEGGKFLSGGQKQKISIGRTILKEPSILILDEATASLDEISQSHIVNLIKDRLRDKTVISVSHRLSTIKDFDNIFVLDRGHIVEEGTYDSLVKKEGLFSELVKKEEGKELPPIAKLVIDRVDEITFTEDSKVSYLLSLCPIFSHMTDLHISYIQKVADISPFSKGEFIYKPGDGSNELYIILRGEVELFYEFKENGISKEKILQSLKPVEIFGEIELFGGEKRKTGARTMCGTILCVIKKKDLMDLISADSCMAIALLKHICSKSAT